MVIRSPTSEFAQPITGQAIPVVNPGMSQQMLQRFQQFFYWNSVTGDDPTLMWPSVVDVGDTNTTNQPAVATLVANLPGGTGPTGPQGDPGPPGPCPTISQISCNIVNPPGSTCSAQAVQTGFGSDDCEYEFNFDFDIPGGGGGGDCNTISLVTNIVGVTFTAPPGTGTLDFTPSAYDQDTCTLTLDATLDIPEYPDPTDEVRFCARLTSKTMISDVPNRVWRYNWVSVEWDLGSSSWVDSGASFGVAYNKAENIYRGERHQGLAMECPPDQMIVEIGQTPAGHFYFSRDLPHTFLVRIAATVVLTEGDAITAPVYAYSVEDVCDGEPLANSNVTPLPTIYSLPVGAHTPPNPGDLIQASWVPSGAGGAPLITITDAYEKPVVLVCDEPGGLNFQNPDNAIQWWWVGGWV